MNYWQENNSKDCSSKKTFPSYRLASAFNKSQSRRGGIFVAKGKKIEKLHVYRCKNCLDYHIGHATRHRRSGGRLRPRFHSPQSYELHQEDYQTEE